MSRFRVFTFLWCAGVLFHQLFQGRFFTLDASAPLTVAAIAAILRPDSLTRFLVVVALQLGVVAWEMPRVVNHWLLMGVTCLGLLLALVPTWISELRGAPPNEEARLRALGPVRVQIAIVYVYATFHKLNSDFVDPVTSCAGDHYRRLADLVPIFPETSWALWCAIAGTLLIEGSLPVLLLVRRTRPFALVLGWGFHWLLGMEGFWDFSTVATPYYAAFLPAWMPPAFALARDRHAWIAVPARIASRVSRSRLSLPIAVALLVLLWIAPDLRDTSRVLLAPAAWRLSRGVWLVGWLALGAVLFATLARSREARGEMAPESRIAWWRQPVMLVSPLLLALNGFSPYLGLKTEHSFAMFSNLRTEGRDWNHLLVPRSLRVFHFQDELVSIVATRDPQLAALRRGGYRLVPFELRRLVAEKPDLALTYTQGPQEVVTRTQRAADDPYLATPTHPVLRKLMLFRPVPPRSRRQCMH